MSLVDTSKSAHDHNDFQTKTNGVLYYFQGKGATG